MPPDVTGLLLSISIHAPCAGGDVKTELVALLYAISIHAPCAGGDIDRVSSVPEV